MARPALGQTTAATQLAVHANQPSFGVDLLYLVRANETQDFGKSGFGGQLRYVQPLDVLGISSFRLDASYSFLDKNRVTVIEHANTFNPSQTTVSLENHALFVTGGLQLQIPTGLLRPYVGVRGGVGRFATDAYSTRNSNYNTIPQDSSGTADNTFVYGGSAGASLVLSAGKSPIFLNFGADYLQSGDLQTLLTSGVGTDRNGNLAFATNTTKSLRYYSLFLGLTFAR